MCSLLLKWFCIWQLQSLSGMNSVSVVAILLVVVFFQVGPGTKLRRVWYLAILLVYPWFFFCFNSENNQGENRDIFLNSSTIVTLRYEDGNGSGRENLSRGSSCHPRQMCFSVTDGDVNNLSFVKHICRSNDFLWLKRWSKSYPNKVKQWWTVVAEFIFYNRSETPL